MISEQLSADTLSVSLYILDKKYLENEENYRSLSLVFQ